MSYIPINPSVKFDTLCQVLLLDSIQIDICKRLMCEYSYNNLVKLLKKDVIDKLGIKKSQLECIVDKVQDVLISNNRLKSLIIDDDGSDMHYYEPEHSSKKYVKYIKNILLNSSITEFCQRGYSDMDTHVIRSIAHCKYLTSLRLYWEFDNISIKKLYSSLIYMVKNNQMLTSMYLGDFVSKNTSIKYFKKFCSALSNHKIFEDINFSYNNINGEKLKILCKALKYNKSLKVLNLSVNNIYTKDCIYIKKLLKYVNLNILKLNYNHNISEYILKMLHSNTSIEILCMYVTNNGLSPRIMKLLKNIKICNIYINYLGNAHNRDIIKYNRYICNGIYLSNYNIDDIYSRNKHNIVQRGIMLQQLL